MQERRFKSVVIFATLILTGFVLPTVGTSTWAIAEIISFTNITNNGSVNVANQIYVEVTTPLIGTVDFRFYNQGPISSSIADIYFDGGVLIGISPGPITNEPGVIFDWGASPSNLPGGKSITSPSVAGEFLNLGSISPIQPNGINPGEELSIRLTGVTFEDLMADLIDRDLRLGIHVQGIGGQGGSDSFMTEPIATGVTANLHAPIPSSLLLLGSGLLGLIGLRKRFRKN